MRIWTTSTLLAVAVAVVLAGCSSDDAASFSGRDTDDAGAPPISAEGDSMDDIADMGEEMADEETAEGDSGGTSGSGEVVTFGGNTSAGRQLARTASLILEVADVTQAAQRVAAAADRAGGFVSGAEVRGGDFGYGRITLRVPAARLDQTVEDLGDVGVRVVESSISTEDLTDQLTDLEARITNLELLEAQLQGLLAEVRDGDPNAQQLLSVFERITQVRGDIERLEAQRAGASDRVALATIHVELLPTATAPDELEPEPETTLGRAWATTLDAFEAIGAALIWFGVTILPVALVVLGIPALLLWLLVRALRRRSEARAAEQLAGQPPSPPSPTPPTTPVGAPTEAAPTRAAGDGPDAGQP